MQDAFRSIGRLARSELAKGLKLAAEGRDKDTQEALNIAADLVERYDSKKARDWAEAGKLDFLARELQQQMAAELAPQRDDRMQLPHHSLLAKDHACEEAGGALRFKLACLLATETTARVIESYFDPANPVLDDCRQLASSALIHPWRMLQGADNRDLVIAKRVEDADSMALWQVQTLDGLDILEGVQ